MSALAAGVAIGLATGVLLHLLLAWPLLRGRACAAVARSTWPAAEVVLCLRGADPQLPALLRGLAAQCYGGSWRLQVVVDAPADGAWPLVATALAALEPQASWGQARLVALADPGAAGSRKCAALLQAFADLDAATAVVALVDGDVLIDRLWLATLVAACLEPGVGAVSGNRWYAPGDGAGPAQLRAIWNAGALLLMGWLQVPWAGSLAVRRELLDSSGWLQALRSSLCEDTLLLGYLRQAGWRYRLLPHLLACDRRSLRWRDLPALERWISRQLLLVRLHHPGWPWLALHATATTLLPLQALLLLGLAPLPSNLRLLLAATLLASVLVWVALLAGLSRALAQPPPRRWAWLPLWVVGTQLLYGLATLRAATARQVVWRGIRYRLQRQGGRWRVSRAAGPAADPPAPAAGWFH